jgi:phosphoribosylglycinamide formyltransferase 1
MTNIAVFASGGGSNLQSLIDHFNGSSSGLARVALTISDREAAGALERARAADIAAHTITARDRTAADIGDEILALLREHDIGLVALAGYLKLVPESVVRALRGRMLNIHPALLPAFGGQGMYGMRVHRAVLDAGCRVTGVTVHHVDERYDEGRPVLQWPVPVLRDDTAESLAARVLRTEHVVYPVAIETVLRALPDPVRGFATGDRTIFEWNDNEGAVSAERLRLILESRGAER